MRFIISASSLILLLATSVFGKPTPLHKVHKYNGKVKIGSYVVTLKPGVDKESLVSELGSSVTHNWDAALVNGFAGQFDTNALDALLANGDIESVAEDGIASIATTQTDAPYNLARLSSASTLAVRDVKLLNYTYEYDAPSPGEGVDIYVVDTGINVDHVDFGGRARWGATFGSANKDVDGNGHGTHVAGTAGGTRFGVAKAASLIAVKVLSDSGSSPWSDIISGFEWVLSAAQSSGRPSIATISIGGIGTQAVDDAVTALVDAGIHVTVSAGNAYDNATLYSPARTPTANTIGATDISDVVADYSNWGPSVDLYAPGTAVTSNWIGNTTAQNTLTGTSMSTPLVAGLIAYIIGVSGNSSPADMSQYLKDISTKGILTGIRNSSINALAHLP